MSAGNKTESFWDFSVRTYRTPGVPDACLSLQNDYGADVNMLLYCCWVGVYVGQFEHELFERASRFSAAWANHVVVPLRSVRTWMKHEGCNTEPVPTDSCMALREKIKLLEFDAEKLQQETLASLTTSERSGNYSSEQTLQAVNANLDRYVIHAGIESCDDIEAKLRVIINAGLGIGVPIS